MGLCLGEGGLVWGHNVGSVPPPSGQGLGRRQRTPSRGPPRPAPTGSSTGRPGCSPRPRALRSAAPPQQPFLPTPRAPPVQFRSLERARRSCPLERGQEGARRSPQFRVACGRRPPRPPPRNARTRRASPSWPRSYVPGGSARFSSAAAARLLGPGEQRRRRRRGEPRAPPRPPPRAAPRGPGGARANAAREIGRPCLRGAPVSARDHGSGGAGARAGRLGQGSGETRPGRGAHLGPGCTGRAGRQGDAVCASVRDTGTQCAGPGALRAPPRTPTPPRELQTPPLGRGGPQSPNRGRSRSSRGPSAWVHVHVYSNNRANSGEVWARRAGGVASWALLTPGGGVGPGGDPAQPPSAAADPQLHTAFRIPQLRRPQLGAGASGCAEPGAWEAGGQKVAPSVKCLGSGPGAQRGRRGKPGACARR